MKTTVTTLGGTASSGARSERRAAMALYGVYEISKILTMPMQLEVTLSGVLALLSSFLDMRHGLVALIDEDGSPEIVVGSGWNETVAKRYFERLPERAIGQIVTTKMPLVVANVEADPLFRDWEPPESAGLCSFIGVPIRERDKVIGTLSIDRDCEDRASTAFDEDVRFLTMIANLVGQTVRLHRLILRDRERLISEQRRLEKTLEARPAADRGPIITGILGESEAIRAVLTKVRLVARRNSTVLLRGESGTGKELFAQALHDLSPRKNGPFVKLNCAALPESVLESELFGHEKGAFTGAIAQRKGRFELADGGTLFLDEIGEISPTFQAKLLRVLQEGEFERVGGTRTLKVDVRLVAATNRNLEEAVTRGEFRADLYYRISVVPIILPPLRERPGDTVVLAREFLRRFNKEHGTSLSLSDDAMAVLSSCLFPGNVRELENCVRRTATFAHDSSIVANDFACRNDNCLSAVLWKGTSEAPVSRSGFIPLPVIGTMPSTAGKSGMAGQRDHLHRSVPPGGGPSRPSPAPEKDDASPLGEESERARLIEAMEMAGWVQAKAARLLGLTPRQIGYSLRKHGIPIKKF